MVMTGLCASCRPGDLMGMPIQPEHCGGSADRLREGVLGGFRCSCPCRNDPKFGDVLEGEFVLKSGETVTTYRVKTKTAARALVAKAAVAYLYEHDNPGKHSDEIDLGLLREALEKIYQ